MRYGSCIVGVSIAVFASISYGQETEYDPAAIKSLTPSQRSEIEKILKANRLLDESVQLRTNEEFEDRLKLPKIKIKLPDPRKELCKVACDVAAASAIAGCGALSGGTAIAVCTAAAVAARESCKRGC